MRFKSRLSFILIMVAALLALTMAPVVADGTVGMEVSRIPLVFIENQGQKSTEVLYHADAAGHSIYFMPDAVVYATGNDNTQSGSVIEISVVGQNAQVLVEGLDSLPGTANFFLGNDPGKWISSVPTFGQVRYGNAMRGVDIVYYGTQGMLKRDILIAPGIDPGKLTFQYSGQDSLSIDRGGNLMVKTATGTLLEAAPVCYQVIQDKQIPVACEYIVLGESLVGFRVGAYDVSYPLVIDPVLDFSSYLGGYWDDQGYAVAVDSLGSAYVTGKTWSTDFPITWWKQVYNDTNIGGYDVFVTKFEPDGLMLNYSTYLGGYNDDSGQGIAVDSAGNAYITGYTLSCNYPVVRAFQPTINSGCGPCSDADAFVTVLNPDGNDLIYSSFLGGNMTDHGWAIDLNGTVDINGTTDVVIVGDTGSWNFPTTEGAWDRVFNGTWDAFVTGISYNGTISNISFSTFLGGDGSDRAYGLAIHNGTGDIYVTGETNSWNFPTISWLSNTIKGSTDAFVTHFDPVASTPISSTYLGGNGKEAGNDIAVDNPGYFYVTGYTQSTLRFIPPPPFKAFQNTLKGFQDAFVTKFNPAGNSLNYSTYIGGNLVDTGTGIAVDERGFAYITGFTDSPNYPTKDALFPSINGYPYDAFVTTFYPNGTSLMFSTYLGGKLDDHAMGIALHEGNVTITGYTMSPDFPVKDPYQPTFGGLPYDAFVARISSIPPVAPIANFTGEVNGIFNDTLLSGPPPLLVNFFDLSTGAPTAWSWDFGDGGSSTLKNPSHIFNTGCWTVNLTVSNLEGSNISSKYWYVQVGALPVACFSADPTEGVEDLPVNFTDCSTGNPDLWVWNFGDGNTACWNVTNRTPDGNMTHIYTNAGNYTPALTVTNEFGSNTLQWHREPPYYQYIDVWGIARVANLNFEPSSTLIPTNSTTPMKLILDMADRGLSGYNITIYFTNPSAADMVSLEYPAWVDTGHAEKSTTPASSVWLNVFDAHDVIQSGATNVELARFNSTGKVPMSTTINVTVTQIDADTGDPIQTDVHPASVTIVALLPLPGEPYPPSDYPSYDGVYWDLNGDGDVSMRDVWLYFHYMNWIKANEPISLFDYNDNGIIDFNDLYLLFHMV